MGFCLEVGNRPRELGNLLNAAHDPDCGMCRVLVLSERLEFRTCPEVRRMRQGVKQPAVRITNEGGPDVVFPAAEVDSGRILFKRMEAEQRKRKDSSFEMPLLGRLERFQGIGALLAAAAELGFVGLVLTRRLFGD